MLMDPYQSEIDRLYRKRMLMPAASCPEVRVSKSPVDHFIKQIGYSQKRIRIKRKYGN